MNDSWFTNPERPRTVSFGGRGERREEGKIHLHAKFTVKINLTAFKVLSFTMIFDPELNVVNLHISKLK